MLLVGRARARPKGTCAPPAVCIRPRRMGAQAQLRGGEPTRPPPMPASTSAAPEDRNHGFAADRGSWGYSRRSIMRRMTMLPMNIQDPEDAEAITSPPAHGLRPRRSAVRTS